MRRKCRERFSRHHGLAIPTCIMARAWHTCQDACRDYSRHSRRMRNPQFYISGERPMVAWLYILVTITITVRCHVQSIISNILPLFTWSCYHHAGECLPYDLEFSPLHCIPLFCRRRICHLFTKMYISCSKMERRQYLYISWCSSTCVIAIMRKKSM